MSTQTEKQRKNLALTYAKFTLESAVKLLFQIPKVVHEVDIYTQAALENAEKALEIIDEMRKERSNDNG